MPTPARRGLKCSSNQASEPDSNPIIPYMPMPHSIRYFRNVHLNLIAPSVVVGVRFFARTMNRKAIILRRMFLSTWFFSLQTLHTSREVSIWVVQFTHSFCYRSVL